MEPQSFESSEPLIDSRFDRRESMMSSEEIQQMLVLAARLREQHGGELDDEAIYAVSEATGAPIDYVRLAVRSVPEQRKKSDFFQQLRSSFLAFDPDKRRFVAGGVLGLAAGFMMFVNWRLGVDSSGFSGIVTSIAYIAAAYNAAISRSLRTSVIAGMITGATSQITLALFALLAGVITRTDYAGSNYSMFLGIALLGGMFGALGYQFFSKNREKLGFGDPQKERHALLQQLLEIQSKLKQDERQVTFMSLDIAGSTRLKAENDPLSVEFTFNEYHRYVESQVTKNGGQIHSTAGDGVTAVFDDPRQAFAAGKAIQAGLFEFNAFRNQLGEEIQLRAAIHSGSVLAPGQQTVAVNFAHVIDVAAHLQKEGPVGTLVVSETSALLLGGLSSISSERITAQNVEGAIWRPKSRPVPIVSGAGIPPGLPT